MILRCATPATTSVVVLVAALLASGCSLLEISAPAPRPVVLDTEETPLRDAFDAGRDRIRMIAVLSPNCASCAQGVRRLKTQVLEARPDVDVDVHLVWGAVLPSDSRDDVVAWMVELDDPRVQHYWDPALLVGHAYGEPLGVEGTEFVWDIYMFFEPGVDWDGDQPPIPADRAWAHQMPLRSGDGGDHQRVGSDLDAFFATTLATLARESAEEARE